MLCSTQKRPLVRCNLHEFQHFSNIIMISNNTNTAYNIRNHKGKHFKAKDLRENESFRYSSNKPSLTCFIQFWPCSSEGVTSTNTFVLYKYITIGSKQQHFPFFAPLWQISVCLVLIVIITSGQFYLLEK